MKRYGVRAVGPFYWCVSMGDEARSGEGVSIELYVRSLSPRSGRSQQDAIVERLQQFDRRGVIESYDVVVTGDCLCPDSAGATTEPGRFLLERVETFESWAAVNDRSLDPFFVRRTDGTDLLGDPATGILFPMVSMAEFADDRLRFVTPCKDGDRTITVRERLAEIRDDLTTREGHTGVEDRRDDGPPRERSGHPS